ncbi:DUF3048 domain-containing protein [Eubacterium coprostanoligenes]|uniref:DUF3048 domain-containing protein n=1 Tax=Eubacterium coprostanoligenes TaxID=290054 RepID=UPI0023565BD6|nr:DUF3048 domain-containing protein [Eubacterium coprostanoligenes]MCI6354711.1 DUF3048 domain-containing protein [Eubacterium coprostanoligenes]
MNDNELEEILNEIKNNKSHKKELDSEGFEDILNSLHSDDVQEPEKVVEKPVKKAEKNSEKPKEVKAETPSKQTKEEFHIVSENPQQEYDEDDFKPANEIADLIEEEPNHSEYIEVSDDAVEDVPKTDEPEYEEEYEEEYPEENAEAESSQQDDKDNIYFSEMAEQVDDKKPKKKGKTIAIVLVVLALVVAIAVGVYFYFFNGNKQDEATTATKAQATEAVSENLPLGPQNPLTGEAGYDESALTQRPVAVVVENEYSTSSVRPQWGLADADIVLEGESEFSTRMLLFWADYNKVPEQVGPARSARPPFIRFSQLFNAVFIHAGLSHSKDNYVGADEVFKNENVDHINLLSFSESSSYFHRDKSRTSTIEHTGCLMGAHTAEMLQKSKINLKLNESKFTKLQFNDEAKALSSNTANEVSFKWSKGYCPKLGKYTYDAEKHKYTTTDFDSKYGTSGVEWENLIFLLDETEYIVKHNYKHAGNSETYCNYNLSGGKGIVCSEGTCVEITWGVKDGKLWMKDAQGNEVKLNPGKSYIGYGSSNHGGYYEVSGATTADSSTTDEQ